MVSNLAGGKAARGGARMAADGAKRPANWSNAFSTSLKSSKAGLSKLPNRLPYMASTSFGWVGDAENRFGSTDFKGLPHIAS